MDLAPASVAPGDLMAELDDVEQKESVATEPSSDAEIVDRLCRVMPGHDDEELLEQVVAVLEKIRVAVAASSAEVRPELTECIEALQAWMDDMQKAELKRILKRLEKVLKTLEKKERKKQKRRGFWK